MSRWTKTTKKIQTTVWLSKMPWEYVTKVAAQETIRAGTKVSVSEVIDRIITDEVLLGRRTHEPET